MKRTNAVAAIVVLAWAGACSSSQELAGAGAPCTLLTDCQTTLVCGKGPNGTRVCTTDPSLVGTAEPPNGTGDAGADPGDGTLPKLDGTASVADGTVPVDDTGAFRPDGPGGQPDTGMVVPPDSGNPPPPDAGGPPDTGTPPPPDSGSADAKAD